jgi:hypothetical protein
VSRWLGESNSAVPVTWLRISGGDSRPWRALEAFCPRFSDTTVTLAALASFARRKRELSFKQMGIVI